MTIEISKPQIVGMTRIQNGGNNLAECSVRIGDLMIRSVRLVFRRSGNILTFPSQRSEDDCGTTLYRPYIELSTELLNQVRRAVVDAYEQMSEYELR